ncbi:hypothetical protein EYZ11_009792 [Aspergillus tanneri]|uniref:Uncharacterized protein n=1 Tax=Aspergillus tanneri TaxID=1220188 RepID=A0A4S3J791_9EURO|nr:hypothetical protein EYZ11_009792 [Aspergillus tanneri]
MVLSLKPVCLLRLAAIACATSNAENAGDNVDAKFTKVNCNGRIYTANEVKASYDASYNPNRGYPKHFNNIIPLTKPGDSRPGLDRDVYNIIGGNYAGSVYHLPGTRNSF